MPDKDTQWPEVVLVIDVCDDPPRPFLARKLDRDGTKGYDWREDGYYLTERYLPVSSIRERLRVAGYESVEGLLLAGASDENGDEFLPFGADVERLTAAIVAVFTAAFPDTKDKGGSDE